MSPVLLIALAALWAAVLVPATLNSRTAAHDDRTINGFSTAMRTLSRRSGGPHPDSRRILRPTAAVTDDRRRARLEAQRRRRLLLSRLLWTSGVTAVLAILLRGPWPAFHVVADLALAATVVHLRRTTLREAEALRVERRARIAEREQAEREAYLASREQRVRQRAAAVRVVSESELEPPRRAVNG